MLGIGMQEFLIVLAVALIILGPKKLPELARTLGRAFAELQRATQDLRSSVDFDDATDDPDPYEEHDEDEEADDDLPPPPGSADEAAEGPEPGEAEETSTEKTS